jgi:hypothetical protein
MRRNNYEMSRSRDLDIPYRQSRNVRLCNELIGKVHLAVVDGKTFDGRVQR